MSQTELFETTGFYCKGVPRVSDAAYAIVLNTNLGSSNAVQQAALEATLAWIMDRHGASGIVYVLGHHPSIMNVGVQIVPETYRSMVKGVLAGHLHRATTTNDALYTM